MVRAQKGESEVEALKKSCPNDAGVERAVGRGCRIRV